MIPSGHTLRENSVGIKLSEGFVLLREIKYHILDYPFYIMTLINKILLFLFKKTLKKNLKYKDSHFGESCYIFGNGSSLKKFDLSKFNDRVSIGCGVLFSHKDFDKLNIPYYYVSHPLFFYKFWRNPFSKKIELNLTGKFYRDNMRKNPDINFFTSLSNYFGIRDNDINYVYHFSEKSINFRKNRMDRVFSSMSGAMDGMLGLAIYMGFRDIILVGCDYTVFPRIGSHFYEYGKRPKQYENKIFAEKSLKSAMSISNIKTVVINNKFQGEIIPCISYYDLTGDLPEYKENYEVISSHDLDKLDNLNMGYKIFKK